MKKVLSLFLAIVLSFALLPTAAFAAGSPVVDSGSLESAITRAYRSYYGVFASDDGKDVYASRKWVTPAEYSAISTAVGTAETVLTTATTQEELDAALEALNTAIALLESQKKQGLKPVPTVKEVGDAIAALPESEPDAGELYSAFQLFKNMLPKEQLKLPLPYKAVDKDISVNLGRERKTLRRDAFILIVCIYSGSTMPTKL